MTADEIRDRLVAALPESLGPVGLRHRAVPELNIESEVTGYGELLLDALLPVVQQIADQRAAEVLAPIRALIDSYDLGQVVPLYRIQRAVEAAADAACIVAEHNAVPRLTAALRAVLEVTAFVEACGVGIAPTKAAVYEDIARRLREAVAEVAR